MSIRKTIYSNFNEFNIKSFAFFLLTVIAYVLGAYFDYYTSPKFAAALAVLYGVLFFFFPETPLYLLKQNKISVG